MMKQYSGMLREPVRSQRLPHAIKGACRAAGGFGRVLLLAALVLLLLGGGVNALAQEPAAGGATGSASPSSDAEITRPRGSTDAIMEAYEKKIERVMGQSDPFYTIDPEDAFSAAEAMKDNKQYGKALELYLKLAEGTGDPEAYSGAAESAEAAGKNRQAIELADKALERYEKQYEAMVTKAKAYSNLDQIPEARLMIEKAMETMSEDGSGIDKAVMDLYKEIVMKSGGEE